MTNTERIQANNDELRECIELAENLPNASGEYPDIYFGPYEVSPNFELQTLKTKNMAMKDNVDIKPISITKVSNQSGGNTVIIGD